jgi:hypothetical protein
MTWEESGIEIEAEQGMMGKAVGSTAHYKKPPPVS